MKNRVPRAVVMVLGLVLFGPGTAFALSSGIWNLARPEQSGCNCHGPGAFLPPGTYPTAVPLLLVHGLPEAYVPGETYDLTLSVLGPVVPFAGFNLEASGGVLESVSPVVPLTTGRAQTGMRVNECEALESRGKCRTCRPGQPHCTPVSCEVRDVPECPVFGPDYPDCACPAGDLGTSACRACDSSTVVSMQAVHSEAAVVPVWSLRWTAPGCGFGPARFYLVGNSVNGSGFEDPADLWGRWPEPQVVPADESGCTN